MKTLAEVEKYAARLVAGEVEDDRPEWLQDLTPPDALYYRLLREAGRGARSLEIGTNRGTSAAHLASLGQLVVTIDHNPECEGCVATLPLTNISFVHGDSLEVFRLVSGPFDLLFIDGDHSPARVIAEYMAYRTLLRPGALVFLDDVVLPEEMRIAWDLIPDPKVLMPEMHPAGGFGVARIPE